MENKFIEKHESGHMTKQVNKFTPDEAAIKIQSFIRIQKAKKLRNNLAARRAFRKNLIKELLRTEEHFVADLTLLIENCYEPLHDAVKSEAPILTQEEVERIFCNLIEIRDTGQKFFGVLNAAIDPGDPYCKIGHFFTTHSADFKVFYPYTANYELAQKALESLRQKKPAFDKFLEDIEFTEKLKFMDIFSFLIKPIQRLTKYPLLLENLVKYTEPEHPDYQGLKEALLLTQKLNQENNTYIEQFRKNLRQIDLQEVFGNPLKMSIYKPGRRLILEETVFTTKEKVQQQHIMFIFNDMILFTPQLQLPEEISPDRKKGAKQQQAKCIQLDENSLAKDISDGKYFSNVFSIVGVNGVDTFSTKDSKTKEAILKTLDGILSDLRIDAAIQDDLTENKNRTSPPRRLVEVHVLGSEERPDGFKSYTYYIVLIACGNNFRKIFKRYSDFLDLSKRLCEQFPGTRLIPLNKEIEIMKSHRSKTIERRKFAIENFLQHALQHYDIQTSPIVADFFKFTEDFFENAEGFQGGGADNKKGRFIVSMQEAVARVSPLNRRRKSQYHSTAKTLNRLSMDLTTSIDEIVTSKTIHEDYLPARHDRFLTEPLHRMVTSLEENKNYSPSFANTLPKHSIDVYLIDGTSFAFLIDERTTAGYICDKIGMQLSLKENDDFRIFLTEGDQIERALDDNECIAEAIHVHKELRANQKNTLWQKIKRVVLDAFRDRPSKLVFKKFYYFTREQEKTHYLNDYVRLKSLVSQALYEVKNLRYDLEYKDYVLLACLGAYNQCYEEIRFQGPLQWLKTAKRNGVFLNFIPQKIYATRSESFWDNAIDQYWVGLVQKIDNIMQSNKQFLEERKMESDSQIIECEGIKFSCSSFLSVDKIVKQLIMSLMWSKKCYGMTIYEAKVKYPSKDVISRGWPTTKFLFGVKYGECQGFSLGLNKLLVTIKLSEIKNIKCYPLSLVLTLEDSTVRLDSKRSFEIYELIRIYQELAAKSEKETTFESFRFL